LFSDVRWVHIAHEGPRRIGLISLLPLQALPETAKEGRAAYQGCARPSPSSWRRKRLRDVPLSIDKSEKQWRRAPWCTLATVA